MFSGKTTELIRRLEAAGQGGAGVIAFKPARDIRYAHDRIAAHTGALFEAVPIAGAEDILPAVSEADVVGIDEAHFFDLRLVDVCRDLVESGKRVIVAGVDVDHRGRPFPVFPPLLALADETFRRTARCARCGGPAEFSQRLVDSDAPILVGGAEAYEPRCRLCFRPPT